MEMAFHARNNIVGNDKFHDGYEFLKFGTVRQSEFKTEVQHRGFAPEPNWSFKGTIMLRIIAP